MQGGSEPMNFLQSGALQFITFLPTKALKPDLPGSLLALFHMKA
jgi:hypothetical protein